MTVSVGLAKIQNDPKASPMTRKALGALSNPRLLVLDQGLTINNDGRLVLRLAAEGGLSESASGLAIELNPDGGLVVDANGLAVAELDDITCNTLTVNTTATVGTILTAGAVVSEGAVSGVSGEFSGNANFGSVTVTGAMSAGNAVITGSVTAASGAFTGAVTAASASISGAMTAGSVAASSAVISGGIAAGSAVISGVLAAGTFAPASISTGSIAATGAITAASVTLTGRLTATDVTAGTGQLVGGGLRIGGGTTLRRMISYFHTITIPAGSGDYDFDAFTSGAIAGDGVLVTIIANDFYWGRIWAWSGICLQNDIVRIRVYCGGGAETTVQFRLVIFGFL